MVLLGNGPESAPDFWQRRQPAGAGVKRVAVFHGNTLFESSSRAPFY